MRSIQVRTAALAAAGVAMAGCGGSSSSGGDSAQAPGKAQAPAVCDGKVGAAKQITAWFHSGSGPERDTLVAQVKAFNARPGGVKVKLKLLPEGDYNEQVQSAAASGDLPEVLDFDGPLIYNYAWSGKLKPIDSCVPKALRANLLPSLQRQGEYAGRFWGIGTFDSGLGIYVRPSMLKKAGVRIPTGADDAWSAQEFTQALTKLRASGIERPLDLKVNYATGRSKEWFTYGLSPILQSAGADLIDRTTLAKADGSINSPAASAAMKTVATWFKGNYVNPNRADDAFVKGQAALSWVGHWEYSNYAEAHGKDLQIVPLPDFGKGSKTGLGSWQWGITEKAADADAAWSFISFLMGDAEIARITEANGGVPATTTAVAKAAAFRPGGPEAIYVDQLQSTAVPRPQTPAYPTISAAFGSAVSNIAEGTAPQAALDEAAEAIDEDIADNDGYPAPAK